MNELTGSVKFFSTDKGFGFIIENETKEEYFVHISNLIDTISENDEVSFDLIEGKKGPAAANVRVI
jgi:CspA family cold shock protein